ncbi:MAG: DUF2169 domain-containing protein [Planctomycetes bacterium]|nr:DUF2169 domain-containing protein [Planctomycetota bacterium]
MWALENETPFAADRGWARDKDGAEVWLVAVKGTFLIRPDGSLELAKEQAPVCVAPKYRGEPGRSSLLYEMDLVHRKSGTDVLLNGHAYAPQGQSATTVDVLLKVGPLSKAVRVFGDRYWRPGLLSLKLSAPEPFLKMPLTYERAYGGPDRGSPHPDKARWDERNPVGLGFADREGHLAGQRAPNLESPRHLIGSWSDRPPPAAFGAIARDWMPRRKYGGTYDQKWEEQRQPLLPQDFDERYWRCAPEDQQTPQPLKGGEPVELFNLTPSGYLKFTLPRVDLTFTTDFGGPKEEHRDALHTVILEPDAPRLMMVWHTYLPCHPRVLKLRSTHIGLKSRLTHIDGAPVQDFAIEETP